MSDWSPVEWIVQSTVPKLTCPPIIVLAFRNSESNTIKNSEFWLVNTWQEVHARWAPGSKEVNDDWGSG